MSPLETNICFLYNGQYATATLYAEEEGQLYHYYWPSSEEEFTDDISQWTGYAESTEDPDSFGEPSFVPSGYYFNGWNFDPNESEGYYADYIEGEPGE